MADAGTVRRMNVDARPEELKLSDEQTVLADQAILAEQKRLSELGAQLARSWKTIPHPGKSLDIRRRFNNAVGVLAGLQYAMRSHKYENLSDDLKWLSDHLRVFAADI